MLAIAREGLKNRGRIGAAMTDETGFLASLDEIAETGVTPAERWLELYHGAWQRRPQPRSTRPRRTDRLAAATPPN